MLTQRTAEELTDYLRDIGSNVRYLHSEIDALERGPHPTSANLSHPMGEGNASFAKDERAVPAARLRSAGLLPA